MHFEFTGELWYWRGPAPHFFVTVPEQQCHDIRAIASLVTYGWGMIPVEVQLGASAWATSLFPKDGRYIVPIKANVRKIARPSAAPVALGAARCVVGGAAVQPHGVHRGRR